MSSSDDFEPEFNLIKASRSANETKKINDNESFNYSPWPMFKGNPQHTGRSPIDTSTNPGMIKWMHRINPNPHSIVDIISSPIIGSDR